ncbi:HNH endonuclease [Actinomadura sp. ATCC 39365]
MSHRRPGSMHGERGRNLRCRLAKRDGSRCFYCRTPFLDPRAATLDHFVPFRLLPRNTQWNLVLACEPCNHRKADTLPWALARLLLTAFGGAA